MERHGGLGGERKGKEGEKGFNDLGKSGFEDEVENEKVGFRERIRGLRG